MGKVVKPLLLVAAVAVNVIPGVGQALSAAAFTAIGSATAIAAAASIAIGYGAVIGVAALALAINKPGGKSSAAAAVSTFDPKSINVDPAARRKMVFGRTAFPVDLRYGEPSGTNQEYIDYVFALAAHRSEAIEEIWIDDKLAWTSAGGAQGIYVGYLTIEVILEGGAGAYHTVNAGTGWGAAQRMTGCTTMKVRVKRSGASTSSASPFANGISGRWTVIGSGMPLYDPALDSTVVGGSGPQRANDCTTWAYTASSIERGRNPALQMLAYLLGYRINGVVSVGLGMAPGLIDLASFATSAARCDEAVTLAAGGSQRRYEAGIAFADDSDPEAVIGTLVAAMNGELIDDGGRLGLRVAVNDLTAAMTLTDDDIQGGFSWNPAPPPAEQFTVVRGRFQQPDAPSLFGMADYPDVAVPRTSPASRPLPLDLAAVQNVFRAERIAKQVGQRSLYQGSFSCRIGVRGWYLRRNMVIAFTSEARGWSAKLFRVRSLRFNIDATVDIVLREENAAVHQWDNDETGNVSPATPTPYDPRNAPWIAAVASAAATADWPTITGTGKPVDYATRNVFRGVHNTSLTYAAGDEVSNSANDRLYYALIDVPTSIALTNTSYWVLKLVSGGGAAGDNAVTVRLTNPLVMVPTAADGSGGTYTGITSQIEVYDGVTRKDTLGVCTFTAVGSPSYASVTSTGGLVTITDWGSTTASPAFDVTYAGVTYRVVMQLIRSLQGVAGPAITMVGGGTITYVDGVLTPGGQSRTLSITRQNATGTATWTTVPGGITLTGSGDSRTLTAANMGSNKQVTIRATVGAVYDEDTVIRADASTAEAGATRNEDGGNLIDKSFTLVDFSSLSGLIRREAPVYAGTSAPYVVVHDATATGLGYLNAPPGFPVKPGETIWISARYFQNSLPGGSTMRLKAEFSNAAGAYISGSDIFVGLRTVGSNFPNVSITDVVDSFVVPANAASCRLSTSPNNSFGSGGYSAVERPWAGRAEPGATVGATAAQITLINTAIADAANAQATADGKIDTFYQATAPAGSEGDLWFDTDDGYRQYRKTGGSWNVVADNRIGQAISDAAGAQATADGKVTTFTGEGTPTAEGVGDLWYKPSIKTLYRWNGASWLVASPTGVSDGATRNEDGGNLIEKPFTLADFSGSESVIRREAPAYAGSSAPYVVVHDSTATGQGYLSLSPGFPVKPGEQIWVAARYYQNSLPASSTMRLKAEFSDAAGAYISGVDAFVGLRTVGSNFPNTTIIDVVDSFTVPAGAASCRLSTNPNNSFGSVGYSAVERPWAGRQAPGATRNVDRGAWSSSSVTYVFGDEVQKDGSTWGAIADHVSSGGNGPPSLPTTSNSTWQLRSRRGDPGADGADGLSIAASVPVIHVAMTPAGLPKSGELPKSTQMVIYYGFTDVTAGCTFSRTTNNCSVTNAGGGAFTVTALTAQPAWFDVTATYGSQSITMRIPINQPLDGSPASRASASVTSMNSTGTYTAIGQVDLVVAAGATINAAGSVNYNAAFFSGTGTRTVRAQARMTIENVSDGGSPVAGSAVIGSAASYIGGDGPSDVGSVSASYSITNSSGGAKLFRAKLEIRYYDGAANIDTTSGSYAGTVEISAA